MRQRWIGGALTTAAIVGVAWSAAARGGTLRDPREAHLANVRQFTHGIENAEAYWSPDGRELIYQSQHGPYACDQIFRLRLDDPGHPRLVSTGKGRTTCGYFLYPAADRILYSSTHLAGDACPAPPDMSKGYVWAVYPSYEIFTALPDGSDLQRLTDNSAYDAEATVCPRDGSIVFTSDRDGDLELYRMDKDGKNLKRLTNAPGYDGGAFFSADCSQIVWRASRPRGEAALAEYRGLLAQHLVRPGRLEIWVANADGTDARQVTYLDAASFAPFFFPDGRRILFSSNYGDPQGREFDIWAINVDGSDLERITYTAGFDGFPMLSPDGKHLVFGSNRNQAGPHQTDIYVADWVGAPAPPAPVTAADRYAADVAYLAADERGGRGIGTPGLEQAAAFIERRFRDLGLEPAGEDGYRQSFEVVVKVERAPTTRLTLDGRELPAESFVPASSSASGSAAADLVAAGYGITVAEKGRDDYQGVDAKGKIVLVRRFAPEGYGTEDERRYGDLHYKAWNAREHGALALLVADLPEVAAGKELPEEAPLPKLQVDSLGDSGIPVIVLKRAAAATLLAGRHAADLRVDLVATRRPTWNVIGRLPAGAGPEATLPGARLPGALLPGAVLVGAHYDHLGMGGPESLAPGVEAVHHGADDNASGTAAMLEIARGLAARRAELRRDVWFVAFSAEEEGTLGSTAFTRQPPPGLKTADLLAMLNLDMVGRLRENRVTVFGSATAKQWPGLLRPACEDLRLDCAFNGDGYGPSDQTPFYAAGVPVLFFFTGVHADYHRPDDVASRINAAGAVRVAALGERLAIEIANQPERPVYQATAAPAPSGDVRSYGASLGTVPDYAGSEGRAGVLLAAVRPGGPAEKAGMRRGDLLVELAGRPVKSVYDLMYVLRSVKPGQASVAVVERDGKRVALPVVFDVSRRF